LNKKKVAILAAAVFFLVLSVVSTYMRLHNTAGRPATNDLALTEETQEESPPTPETHATAAQPPVEADKAAGPAAQPDPPEQTPHFQRALADYAAGLLYNARQTLKMLSTTTNVTPETLAARRTLSMISTVQALHAQALEAQAQKKYAEALEYWDRLLLADMELVGDRPSFFAMQAEQKVQKLSYEYAMDAYRLKNFQKARQLCQAILQINPENPEALALLAKIDPKA
jgi:tetratricopeptide (TPR) repeat protein